MTDTELRLHRKVVMRVDPSLPQRAGRAFAKLQRGEWSQAGTISPGKKGLIITVRSIMKPKPDPKLYVRTLVQLSMNKQGLPPTWTGSEVDALLAKFGSNGRTGDAEPGANPRK